MTEQNIPDIKKQTYRVQFTDRCRLLVCVEGRQNLSDGILPWNFRGKYLIRKRRMQYRDNVFLVDQAVFRCKDRWGKNNVWNNGFVQ